MVPHYRHSGMAATRRLHVQQPPLRPRATGLPALPAQPQSASSVGGNKSAHASSTARGSPHHTAASAVPSALHSSQAPHPPVPSATAAPPTAADVSAAERSVAAACAADSAAAAPAVAKAVAAPTRGRGDRSARRSFTPRTECPRPPPCYCRRTLRRRHR